MTKWMRCIKRYGNYVKNYPSFFLMLLFYAFVHGSLWLNGLAMLLFINSNDTMTLIKVIFDIKL